MSGEAIPVADAFAQILEGLGVETAFGITSVHNVGLLDAIGRRGNIRFAMCRGEMGAAHMADGYARASGKLGVVITSTGPAAANAAPGVLEASLAASPVLHITGQSARAFIGRGTGAVHDVPDQLGMLQAVSKAALRVHAPEALHGTLLNAAAIALTPPFGPVSIEIPIDVQRASVAWSSDLARVRLELPRPVAASEEAIGACAELVSKAKRPLLWIGSGARHAGLAVRRLLDLGFCLITSWSGRAVVSEDDPRSLGALNGVLSPRVDAFVRECDLLLVVGSRLRHQQTRDKALFLPRPLAQIDIDPNARDRTYESDLFLEGDAEATLDKLVDRLSVSVDNTFQRDFAAMKEEAVGELHARHGPYASFPTQLREAMPRDAIWARDMTLSNNTWGHHAFLVHGPRDSVFPVGGGIGVGLPLAIGAAASGRKTVLLSGDGGFALNSGEIWTAIQEKLDLLVIVMNDRGYGVIKHLQTASHGGRHFYTDLAGPDLEGFARLGGMPFRRVSKANQFGGAVKELSALSGPKLIEVDMQAVGVLPYTPLSKAK